MTQSLTVFDRAWTMLCLLNVKRLLAVRRAYLEYSSLTCGGLYYPPDQQWTPGGWGHANTAVLNAVYWWVAPRYFPFTAGFRRSAAVRVEGER